MELIRFKNPTGVLFVFTPAAWSICLAAYPGQFPNILLMSKFALGSFLIRSSACIINDTLDKDIDAKVIRTSNRVMVKELVSLKEAIILTSVMMILAFLILLSLNNICILEGILCVPLMLTYPLFKRFTYWPQLMLGITTGMGSFMGWSAVHNNIEPLTTIPLFIGSASWTIFYDTIYGFQDMQCDKKAGIQSTSLLFTSYKIWKLILSLFPIISIFHWIIVGYNTNQTWPFYISLGIMSIYFYSVIKMIDISNSKKNLKLFRSNAFISLCFLIAMIISNKLKRTET
ncbi:hypothetical protein HZS_5969 [Henneguya salminicola]|nr:hypothetical protein HZS_5969 [Henneguya salminicola]